MTRLPLFALPLALACAPESVDSVTLTPTSPDVEAALLAADARWEAAGVAPERVVIGEGGAPVRFTPERGNTSETRIVGRGSAWAGVRYVELHTLDVDNVTHELGHSLGINTVVLDVSHPFTADECGDEHTHRHLMCAVGGGVITPADLDFACSVGSCVGYSPEDTAQ